MVSSPSRSIVVLKLNPSSQSKAFALRSLFSAYLRSILETTPPKCCCSAEQNPHHAISSRPCTRCVGSYTKPLSVFFTTALMCYLIRLCKRTLSRGAFLIYSIAKLCYSSIWWHKLLVEFSHSKNEKKTGIFPSNQGQIRKIVYRRNRKIEQLLRLIIWEHNEIIVIYCTSI